MTLVRSSISIESNCLSNQLKKCIHTSDEQVTTLSSLYIPITTLSSLYIPITTLLSLYIPRSLVFDIETHSFTVRFDRNEDPTFNIHNICVPIALVFLYHVDALDCRLLFSCRLSASTSVKSYSLFHHDDAC